MLRRRRGQGAVAVAAAAAGSHGAAADSTDNACQWLPLLVAAALGVAVRHALSLGSYSGAGAVWVDGWMDRSMWLCNLRPWCGRSGQENTHPSSRFPSAPQQHTHRPLINPSAPTHPTAGASAPILSCTHAPTNQPHTITTTQACARRPDLATMKRSGTGWRSHSTCHYATGEGVSVSYRVVLIDFLYSISPSTNPPPIVECTSPTP